MPIDFGDQPLGTADEAGRFGRQRIGEGVEGRLDQERIEARRRRDDHDEARGSSPFAGGRP